MVDPIADYFGRQLLNWITGYSFNGDFAENIKKIESGVSILNHSLLPEDDSAFNANHVNMENNERLRDGDLFIEK